MQQPITDLSAGEVGRQCDAEDLFRHIFLGDQIRLMAKLVLRNMSEVGRVMVGILGRRDNVQDPRYRGGLLSWLIEKDGWVTPVWTHLTYYSSSHKIIRFRNDQVTKFPANQWQHREPDQFHFELTALISELDHAVLGEVIDYCELARRQPKSRFDRHPPCFPIGSDRGSYGWTVAATKAYEQERKGR